MRGALDVVLYSSFILLVLAKALSVPPEWGVPGAFAAAVANAWHIGQS